MSAFATLMKDLEFTMERGSGDERAAALSRVTDFFLSSAKEMDEEQVGIFDMVIGRLARAIELRARVELSERLADIPNAPVGVVRQLALDDIQAARPVLIRSPRLSDEDLVRVSSAMGREHMLAITERPNLGERITDFLILRGGRMVTHAIAANQTARFSRHGMGVLVMRAVQDDVLQAALVLRADVPAELTEQLMRAAKISARRRLNESLAPTLSGEIDEAIEKGAEAIVAEGRVPGSLKQVSAALAEVRKIHEAGQLNEEKVRGFAKEGASEHVICAVSVLTQLSLTASEQVVFGSDREMILFVTRGLGWTWETTAALISLRKDFGKSPAALDKSRESFRNLAKDTAQRVVGFLKTQQSA